MEKTTGVGQSAATLGVLPARASGRIAYFIELTKPRILVMILLTVIMAMVAAGTLAPWNVLWTCLGTAMVAASASVLNQWIERERDAVMQRTSRRPLPMGRVAASQAAWMGWVLVIGGLMILGLLVNLPTMACGLATWFLYVAVYTPLKLRHWSNTLVGALPGALPVWMGWTAADGSLADPRAWTLLGILIAWQLPHFMAIAWLYREQYAAAGYKMITVTDTSGRGASWHAILGSLALFPLTVAALPPVSITLTIMCGLGLAVSVWMLRSAISFSRLQNQQTARRMLRVSLMHLPLMMLVILLARLLG
ncbi:MAG: protoheme IX farnesyltransferase [Pirellulaceae bacterium]|nr:protoheme IX farnesyltransferase [Pirellulaceae bacterium]